MSQSPTLRIAATAALVIVASIGSRPVRAQPAPHAMATVSAVADSFLVFSAPRREGRVWPDLSDALREAGRKRTDWIVSQLSAMNLRSLSDSDRLIAENLLEINSARQATSICRFHLWAGVSQFSGWHVAAANWARTQSVADDTSRTRALETLRGLPAAIDAERALMQRGLDSGYTAAAPVIEALLKQYAQLLPDTIETSPLFVPATKADAAFRQKWKSYLADSVGPAVTSYSRFLREVYLPKARPEGSLATLPDGVACYQASLRAQSSSSGSIDSLMIAARNEVTRIHAELKPLVTRLTGDSDVGRAVQALRADRRFTFPSRDSILPAYQAMTKRAEARIGKVVAGFAPESLAVVAYPEFQEKAGLPPQYLRANESGTRPAQFLVNLSRTERMSVANAVAHEAYPGHHLQRIAEARAPVAHPAMRTLSVGGFSEGWGIYSERLADEMGLYESELDRAGYLVHLLDVAMAAWLDVGYHARRWTRADLVDSMMVFGGRPRPMAEAYADRHAATPGQLATYFIGFNEITSARSEAERRLGAAFRLPEFNREVLRDGTITLSSMRAKMARWEGARSQTTATK